MLANLLLTFCALSAHRNLRGINFETLQEPDCPTVAGPSSDAITGVKCSFPFIFRDITYYGCTNITDTDHHLWCSVATASDGTHLQGNWGYCNETCTHHITELSGNDDAADTPCPSPELVSNPGDGDQVFSVNPITNYPTPAPDRALSDTSLWDTRDTPDVWAEFTPNDGTPILKKAMATESPVASAVAGSCTDFTQHSWCSTLEYFGYCSWHPWVQANCANTCGLCTQQHNQLEDTLHLLEPEIQRQVREFHPAFHFDDRSCFPDYAITRTGQPNPGLSDTTLTDGCRASGFLSRANTYHRWTSQHHNGHTYHVHLYDLYFQKDRVPYLYSAAGHKHDVETVIVYVTDGRPTHVAVSGHGEYKDTQPWSTAHPQVLYQSEYWNTHSFRIARPGEFQAQGVFPPLASWYLMTGDQGWTNQRMRDAANTFYAQQGYSLKVSDSRFLIHVNNPYKPAGYPRFTL